MHAPRTRSYLCCKFPSLVTAIRRFCEIQFSSCPESFLGNKSAQTKSVHRQPEWRKYWISNQYPVSDRLRYSQLQWVSGGSSEFAMIIRIQWEHLITTWQLAAGSVWHPFISNDIQNQFMLNCFWYSTLLMSSKSCFSQPFLSFKTQWSWELGGGGGSIFPPKIAFVCVQLFLHSSGLFGREEMLNENQ